MNDASPCAIDRTTPQDPIESLLQRDYNYRKSSIENTLGWKEKETLRVIKKLQPPHHSVNLSTSHTTTMADDTREPTPSPAPPRAPANIMPGGTAHTAGGQKADDSPSYVDVVRNLPSDYYLHFYQRPCVRDSQLTAISSGFAGYMVGAIMRSMLQCHQCGCGMLWCEAHD